MVELLLAGGAAYGGYKYTKKFVVKKLRFVPKARKKAAKGEASDNGKDKSAKTGDTKMAEAKVGDNGKVKSDGKKKATSPA